MGSFFDMHIHTTAGSPDSSLSPRELVSEARRIGLTGVVITEHNGWPRHDFEDFARDQDIVLVRANEVYTNMGHVITLGQDKIAGMVTSVQDLREAVDNAGGFMIIAHPFRYLFEPSGILSRNILFEDPLSVPATPEEAAEHTIFSLVDAIEVVNGANNTAENRFAQEVAAVLGFKGTGGSDAHSRQGIGLGSTLFHGDVRNVSDLMEALRAGAFTPCYGFNKKQILYYGELPALYDSVPPENPA